MKFVSKVPIDSIGSYDGLALNRRQAITWTNDDPIHWHPDWHIYASLRGVGGGELYIHIFAGALEGPMQTLVGTVKSCENVALWDCCIRSLLMIHVTSFEVECLRRLSKCYSIHNKDQSWYLTNDPSCMVEIMVFKMTHSGNNTWPSTKYFMINTVSDLYIFDHQRVNTSWG